MTRIAQKSELTVPAIAAWKWESSVSGGTVHELRLFFVWSVRFFITIQLIKKRTKCTVCDLKSKTFLDGNTTNNHGRGDLVPLRQTTSGASRSTVRSQKWFKIIAPMSEIAAPTQPPLPPGDPWRHPWSAFNCWQTVIKPLADCYVLVHSSNR